MRAPMDGREDETPTHERKRLRLEAPRRDDPRSSGSAQRAPHMLPFVSPELPPRGRAFSPDTMGHHRQRRHQPSMVRTPLQVRASGRSQHSGIPSSVQDHLSVTKKKVRSSIAAHKNSAMRQLEQQYQALREKILAEIGDADQQFKVLQQANDNINEKTDRKLKTMAELAATEIRKIEKARATAISSSAQLYTKEKQKILQRFDAELAALTK